MILEGVSHFLSFMHGEHARCHHGLDLVEPKLSSLQRFGLIHDEQADATPAVRFHGWSIE